MKIKQNNIGCEFKLKTIINDWMDKNSMKKQLKIYCNYKTAPFIKQKQQISHKQVKKQAKKKSNHLVLNFNIYKHHHVLQSKNNIGRYFLLRHQL